MTITPKYYVAQYESSPYSKLIEARKELIAELDASKTTLRILN